LRFGRVEEDARFADVAEARAGVLDQAAAEEVLEMRGRVGDDRLPVDDRRQGLRRVVTAVEALAGEHLGQDHAERPDVGAAVHWLPLGLLGRHIRSST